ncbi:MAG TPA: cobyric acid synthase [Nitrospirota bacterium]|nr:cobyric acid synthase [Nitrospirota bacterium]
MTKALMIQGTGSGVGKSLLVAGLCRLFRNAGVDVAPFKAQNMALNSFITREGGEIGRAQALQAEAARVEPSFDMNPILLKAASETSCQVIMHGRVHSNMDAQSYYAFKNEAWPAVTESFDRLSKQHELIVIEGAGSPAEINLSKDEVVNMSIARYAQAPVILVGDIDKGGVFASLFGTIALLDGDARYIRAFVINKFRGDMAILEPGLHMIREKTGRPVLGVIPYLGDLGLHEEDGIPLERYSINMKAGRPDRIKIVVLRLRYIANFTDFDPFLYETDVEVIYSLRAEDIENADVVMIPGSKNTVHDLQFLRETGIAMSVKRAAEKGAMVVGLCGGYQMLGQKIFDPFGVESNQKEVAGLGLLDTETVFENSKVTSQAEAVLNYGSNFKVQLPAFNNDEILKGYEIHMGRTTGDVGLFLLKRTSARSERWAPDSERIKDGSAKGTVWGTYLHGIFDNDRFRRDFLNGLREKRGFRAISATVDYAQVRDRALENWAAILQQSIDMKSIEDIIHSPLV